MHTHVLATHFHTRMQTHTYTYAYMYTSTHLYAVIYVHSTSCVWMCAVCICVRLCKWLRFVFACVTCTKAGWNPYFFSIFFISPPYLSSSCQEREAYERHCKEFDVRVTQQLHTNTSWPAQTQKTQQSLTQEWHTHMCMYIITRSSLFLLRRWYTGRCIESPLVAAFVLDTNNSYRSHACRYRCNPLFQRTTFHHSMLQEERLPTSIPWFLAPSSFFATHLCDDHLPGLLALSMDPPRVTFSKICNCSSFGGPRQLCLGQLHVEILWYHTSNDSRLCGRMLCQTKRTKLVATKPETEWNGGNRDSVSQDSKTQALTSQDDRDTMKMNWLKKCPGMSRQGKFAM